MKTLLTLVGLILTLICSSCTTCIDTEQELIKNYKPFHMAPPVYGRYGDYSYNLYPMSVELLALSPEIPITLAEIFDTNSDGVFDSVWIMEKGKWSYCSTRNHPILVNTASKEVLRNFIALAHVIEKQPRNKAVSKLLWDF